MCNQNYKIGLYIYIFLVLNDWDNIAKSVIAVLLNNNNVLYIVKEKKEMHS